MRTDHFFGLLMIVLLGGATLSPLPQAGLYSISYRLEMPHLERYSVERRVEQCVDPAVRFPVLGTGPTFDGCEVSSFAREGESLRYWISCPGRAAARAEAVYQLEGNAFTARIAITLGAKNMTVIEVQRAIRIGPCR